MRRVLALAGVVLVSVALQSAVTLQARSVKSPLTEVLQRYESEDGVESVQIGGFLLGIAKTAMKGEEEGEILKYLDRMTVFSAGNASASLKAALVEDLEKVLKDYQKAVEMKDDGDDMTIWFKMQGEDVVSEMLMFSGSETAVILMQGEIPVEVLAKFADQATQE